jgi:hypothetical protein
MAPLKYMHHGDIYTGVPPHQYGFGLLKVNPYQKGSGYYKPRRRRQRGRGFGSALFAIGRKLIPKLIPIAKKIGKSAVKEGIRSLPSMIGNQNKKQAARQIVERIGKQAVGAISQGQGRKRRGRRVKKRGQLSRRRR